MKRLPLVHEVGAVQWPKRIASRCSGGGVPGGSGGVAPCGPGGTTAGGTGGGTTTLPFPCEVGEPIVVGGVVTGYETCGHGYRHRPEATDCPSVIPRDTICDDAMSEPACTLDSDCVDGENGYCRNDWGSCWCAYGCTSDADCADGMICLCGDPVGECVSATCTTDADCGDLLCTEYVTDPGCGGPAFVCQTPQDQCAVDADCADGQMCSHDGTIHFCSPVTCVIGRPFLVWGEPRLAPTVESREWSRDLTVQTDGLDPETRTELSEHWIRIGQMEHAAVAAFARLALQLLSHAAPADLLERCQTAMSDEIEHARLAFALASAYAARDIGPGALELEGSLEQGSLWEIVRNTVIEGCIGETIAAVEAAEAAAHARDPEVKRVLDQVAVEETRHGELAWQVVAWALRVDSSLAVCVREEIDAALGEARPGGVVRAEEQGRLAHGRLPAATTRQIRHQILRQVIAPCADALLGSVRTDRRRSSSVSIQSAVI